MKKKLYKLGQDEAAIVTVQVGNPIRSRNPHVRSKILKYLVQWFLTADVLRRN